MKEGETVVRNGILERQNREGQSLVLISACDQSRKSVCVNVCGLRRVRYSDSLYSVSVFS